MESGDLPSSHDNFHTAVAVLLQLRHLSYDLLKQWFHVAGKVTQLLDKPERPAVLTHFAFFPQIRS